MSPLSELHRETLLKQAQDIPLPDDEEEVDWSPEPKPDERTTQCETDLQTCLKTAADKDAAREEEMKKLQARFTQEFEVAVAEKERRTTQCETDLQTCLKTAADKDAAREEEMKKLQARFMQEFEVAVAEKERLAVEVIAGTVQTCEAEKAELEQTIADFQRKIADHLEMKDVYIARMERATGKVDNLEKTIAEQRDYIQKLNAHIESITQLFQVEYQKVDELLKTKTAELEAAKFKIADDEGRVRFAHEFDDVERAAKQAFKDRDYGLLERLGFGIVVNTSHTYEKESFRHIGLLTLQGYVPMRDGGSGVQYWVKPGISVDERRQIHDVFSMKSLQDGMLEISVVEKDIPVLWERLRDSLQTNFTTTTEVPIPPAFADLDAEGQDRCRLILMFLGFAPDDKDDRVLPKMIEPVVEALEASWKKVKDTDKPQWKYALMEAIRQNMVKLNMGFLLGVAVNYGLLRLADAYTYFNRLRIADANVVRGILLVLTGNQHFGDARIYHDGFNVLRSKGYEISHLHERDPFHYY